MLVHAVVAWLDKPTFSVRAAWVVWCSPTHGGGRPCLGLLRPTLALGWPWCPPWCNRGIRVQQPILMRGNRSKSPIRCHPWGIAIMLGSGRLLPRQLHSWRAPKGADQSRIPRRIHKSSDGSEYPSSDPWKPKIARDVDLWPPGKPLPRSSARCVTSGSET